MSAGLNLQALVGKIVTVWLATAKREICGTLTAYTDTAIEVRCVGLPDTGATVWQVSRADIIAVGCNEDQ